MIQVSCEHYTDYSWVCSCGKRNVEPEGQLDIDDGNNLFCSSCNKEYILDKPNLKLIEAKEE